MMYSIANLINSIIQENNYLIQFIIYDTRVILKSCIFLHESAKVLLYICKIVTDDITCHY